MSGWEATGLTVVNSKDVSFSMYSIDLAAGETITLGANGGSSGCVFYTIMATNKQAAVTTTTTTTTTTAVTTTMKAPDAVLYDATCDGRINIFDLIAVKRHVGGSSVLDGAAFINADTNSDGSITIADIVAVQKKLLGLK